MNFSYWEQQTYFFDIDVAIIGSGVVGLSAAYQLKLKQPDLKVIIFEKNVLTNGISSKDEGLVSFGSASQIVNDLKKNNENEVFSSIEKRWRGMNKIRELFGDDVMDYEAGGCELFENDESIEPVIEKLDYVNQNIEKITGNPSNFSLQNEKVNEYGFQKIKHLIGNSGDGKINTGKMMKALLHKVRNENVEILNGIKALSIQPTENGVYLILDGGFILKVKKVLVTTNGFAKELLPELDVRPIRKQIVLTSVIPDLKINSAFNYNHFFFRNIDNRVMIGNGKDPDNIDETSESGFSEPVQNKLLEILRGVILPQNTFTIDYRWSSISGYSKDNLPIVKKVVGNIYCAVKMQDLNVSMGYLIGEEVADLIIRDL